MSFEVERKRMDKEYIEREAAKVFVTKSLERVVSTIGSDSPVAEGYNLCIEHAASYFKFIPAASDVAEVRHGKWKKRGNEKTCSECKFIYYSNKDEWNYCPNCGSKMDGKDGVENEID